MTNLLMLIISINVLCLILFFNTDAFVEYARILRLNRLFKIDKFDDAYKNDFELTYHQYLRINHNCFFVRLITCPICLSFWLCLIGCIIGGIIISLPIVYLLSIFLYYLFAKIQR